jgi:hypothetical protein
MIEAAAEHDEAAAERAVAELAGEDVASPEKSTRSLR